MFTTGGVSKALIWPNLLGALPAHGTGTRSFVSEIRQVPGEDQAECRLRQAGRPRLVGAHGFHAAEAFIAMAQLTCGLCGDLPGR
jgi:hypothetical protein